MKDFIRVYLNWLSVLERDSNFEYFIVWLWTLTESQLDEVTKKYEPHNKQLLSVIDTNYKAYDLKIADIVKSVKNCRMEYSLLYNPELALPLCEVDYVKAIMDHHFGPKHLHDLEDKHLERATIFYNDFERYDGMILGLFWNQNIADEAKNILAERFLLKNEV